MNLSETVIAALPGMIEKAKATAKAKGMLVWLFTTDNATIEATGDMQKLPENAFVLESVATYTQTSQMCWQSALDLR
jgi:hypothetical protein